MGVSAGPGHAYSGVRTASGVSFSRLAPREWRALRDARLTALADAPGSFRAAWEEEQEFPDQRWRDEFRRGDWFLARSGAEVAGLLGITRYGDIPGTDRYLEYLWVPPARRRSGIARAFLQSVAGDLSGQGVAALWLWVLDGNLAAISLYERLGFVPTGDRNELRGHHALAESRMRLSLPPSRTPDGPAAVTPR